MSIRYRLRETRVNALEHPEQEECNRDARGSQGGAAVANGGFAEKSGVGSGRQVLGRLLASVKQGQDVRVYSQSRLRLPKSACRAHQVLSE